TFFQGVRELPAAHYALVTAEESTPRRYWALPAGGSAPAAPEPQARREYTELFTDAVRLRLRADVAIGTCLSGGGDSSSIVAAALHEAHAMQNVTGLRPGPLLARALASHLPAGLLRRRRAGRVRQAASAAALQPDLADQWLSGIRQEPVPYADLRSLDTHLA